MYDLYGIARDGFDICSIQFALHYMFESKETLHNFIKNVYNFTKVNGYFIGCCFNGKRVFNFIKNLGYREEKSIIKDDKKIFGIRKHYNSEQFLDDETSLGMEIVIYQETINQYISEYLVNFDYFIRIMQDYGFVLVKNPFIEDKRESIGGFKELYDQLISNPPPNMKDFEKMSYEEKNNQLHERILHI